MGTALRSSPLLKTLPVERSFSLENNPFDVVIVDATHRCNMHCANCYVPNRSIPDLDADWIIDALSRLPRRTNVRLAGGEPTLREDLPDLIRRIKELGHHVSILSNGLLLADRNYLRALKQAGLRIVYLSMNGGFDDDAYEIIDELRCAEKKILALHNLDAEYMYASIGMIVVPGVNERQIGVMFDKRLEHRSIRELHFRGVGAMGRHMDSPSQLTLERLRELFAEYTGADIDSIPGREDGSYYVDFTIGRVKFQLTQWPDLGSTRRGRLTPERTIAPFMEHVIANDGGY